MEKYGKPLKVRKEVRKVFYPNEETKKNDTNEKRVDTAPSTKG